jgi:transcriptional regulator with GAF, ATPase, and Fis domain
VLVTGETGVGKELVARFIHETSPRSKQPLIKVNCPSIPESMFESELFGHERGAFTSAVQKRIGRFELAADGTLFLDEIGELSLAVQAKLLRVLQDGEFERVGGSKTLTSNARIITATNRDLSKAVDEGSFRADLYFRLNVFPIHVPPLRDRRPDIPQLAQAFAEEFGKKSGKRIERVDEDDLAKLQQRPWPGNIRELRHLVERAVILCDGPVLQLVLNDTESERASDGASATSSLDVVQADEIRRVLDGCNWVVEGASGAAAALGMKPSTLRFRMKRLGISRSAPPR